MTIDPLSTALELGAPLADWRARSLPPRTPMTGERCVIEPLDPARHEDDLMRAFVEETPPAQWTYLPYGPFDAEAFSTWLRAAARDEQALFHAILERETGTAVGLISYLNLRPEVGSLEVGHVHFSPRLKRSATATEALYLFARRVFDELGYRRYEWKCNSLNEPSRRAALRLGFTFEGTFRQHLVTKGRNRDTSWFSMLDGEWPRIRRAYEAWLAPENFDTQGLQRAPLSRFLNSATELPGRNPS